MDREHEVRRLAEADRHIVAGEAAVATQIMQVDELRRDHHDTVTAEATLKAFQDTLEAMKAHRATILETIHQIDEGLIPSTSEPVSASSPETPSAERDQH